MTDAAKDPIQDLQERLSRLEAQVARRQSSAIIASAVAAIPLPERR